MDFLFGKGDDDYPLWLLTVRINVLVALACLALLAWMRLATRHSPQRERDRFDTFALLALTIAAALLRFGAVEHNLADLGGIGYSRILLGYKGHFGAAQLYSLVYARTARDLEHAILLNRFASTVMVPLVYALCRRLAPALPAFAGLAAVLVLFNPLLLLFAATDALSISSSMLAVTGYLLLSTAFDEDTPLRQRQVSATGAAAILGLLTQVRYENLLFLFPAAIFVGSRSRWRSLRQLWVGAAVLTILAAIYLFESSSAGSSYVNPVPFLQNLRVAGQEIAANDIFVLVPILFGTTIATLSRRSRIRWLSILPLPVIAAVGGLADPTGFVIARAYTNLALIPLLVAGYGLALLWSSPWRWLRLLSLAAVAWTLAVAALFWPNFNERHLETAEHDFFRSGLEALPADVTRVVVPDDELMRRQSHTTLETLSKYQFIAAASSRRIAITGMTELLEHPQEVACAGHCVFFRGVPCVGLSRYWFAPAECNELMKRTSAAIVAEDVTAGSTYDCAIYRGELRRRLCEPVRKTQRLGFYRLTE